MAEFKDEIPILYQLFLFNFFIFFFIHKINLIFVLLWCQFQPSSALRGSSALKF